MEKYLAKLRGKQANLLIPAAYRQGSILDIGCGLCPLFLLSTDFRDKYGLDKEIDKKRIESTAIQGIKLINFDLEQETQMPLARNCFDVVVLLAVLEHLYPEKVVAVLKEVQRILKPGGMLIVTTPAAWTDNLLKLLAKLRLVSSVEIEEHKETYSHSRIAARLKMAGFLEAQMKFGYFELGLNIWATARK